MKPNIDPNNGLAFGYVAANDLDPDIVERLMHGPQAHDDRYADALDQALDGAARALNLNSKWDFPQDVRDELSELFELAYEPADEPSVYGIHQGVEYCSSWLGGALNFFIARSPVVSKGRRASPCVPNAGVLNPQGDGDVDCYGVPSDWWAEMTQEA